MEPKHHYFSGRATAVIELRLLEKSSIAGVMTKPSAIETMRKGKSNTPNHRRRGKDDTTRVIEVYEEKDR